MSRYAYVEGHVKLKDRARPRTSDGYLRCAQEAIDAGEKVKIFYAAQMDDEEMREEGLA